MDQQQSYRLIQSGDGQNRGQIMISDNQMNEQSIQHVVYSQHMNSNDQQQVYYQVQPIQQTPQQQVFYQIQNQNNADHQNLQHTVSINRTVPNQQQKV
jgi:hypothetical protein